MSSYREVMQRRGYVAKLSPQRQGCVLVLFLALGSTILGQTFVHGLAALRPARAVGSVRGKREQPNGRPEGEVGLRALLKDVVFGIDANQKYVDTSWGQIWNSGTAAIDVLGQRKAAGNSTVVRTASFGPEGQYYLEFPDLRYWYIQDPTLRELVTQHPTEFVSFGPKKATFVMLKSGAYYMRNIPLELQDAVTGRARSGNEDHNRVASVTLGNDAYFVTFKGGGWKYKGIPKSMSEYIAEHIWPNWPDEVFEQVSFSQDLSQWYLRTNKRWWYQSSVLRKIEDKYKPASLQVDEARIPLTSEPPTKKYEDDDDDDDDWDDDDDYYDYDDDDDDDDD
ncbi:unnamed protein product, partial [Symbiodinium microadriaticum]